MMKFPIFRPHPLLRSGHAQTLFTYISRGVRAPEATDRHLISLPDGDRLVLHDNCPRNWTSTAPAVLLLHGLTGSFRSCYMQRCARKMNARGWRVFRLDHRGCGAGTGLADFPYHAGRIGDLQAALERVERLCPSAPLFSVGFSLSGNIVLKLAATQPESLPRNLKGLSAICPAVDLERACANICNPANRYYDRFFVKRLWKHTLEYQGVHRLLSSVLAAETLPESLREYDNLVTAPLAGFRDANDYYRHASCREDLKALDHPTLIIAAADDPLVPAATFAGIELAEQTRLILADGGGHLGFFGRAKGADADTRWADWRIIDWVDHLQADSLARFERAAA
jgi:uncharacterized protein